MWAGRAEKIRFGLATAHSFTRTSCIETGEDVLRTEETQNPVPGWSGTRSIECVGEDPFRTLESVALTDTNGQSQEQHDKIKGDDRRRDAEDPFKTVR